jgi:hypothetical protein
VKNNFTFLFSLFFLTQFLMAQGIAEKRIRGQITSDAVPIEGVNVTNTKSKVNAVSDQYGNFSILAKEGDILSFSAVNYEPLRKYINKQQYYLGTVVVDMTAISIELKEVIINERPDISAENLGIIPRDQIKLTSNERKLQTAGDFKPIHLLGLLGGMLAVDPILNAINGRTKMLKKAVSVEKKEFLMAKLEFLFEDKYYIETLKITEDRIKGFQYYCVEDTDFVNALNSKNKTMCMFLIVGLASNYNKNIENEVEKH